MKCTDVRAALPLLIYGESSTEDAAVREHLANCPDCRREYEALQGVRRLLDKTSVPHVAVDLHQLHCSLSERQQRREKRWQHAALTLGALAAALLVAFGLHLDIRFDASQLVVRWGDGPPPVAETCYPDFAIPQIQAVKPDVPEELRVLSELIHALKQDADSRDQRFSERLDRLQEHVHALQSQADLRWDTTEKDVAALYLLTRKGEKP
jgi:hypothetical protein